MDTHDGCAQRRHDAPAYQVARINLSVSAVQFDWIARRAIKHQGSLAAAVREIIEETRYCSSCRSLAASKQHPELVAAFMQTAAADFAARLFDNGIDKRAAAIDRFTEAQGRLTPGLKT
jgi:hypothetical protein